jgi:hypothetical protein
MSYHFVFTRALFLFFQHSQQHDTLLPITPCTHKLKAGIVYFRHHGFTLWTRVLTPDIYMELSGDGWAELYSQDKTRCARG